MARQPKMVAAMEAEVAGVEAIVARLRRDPGAFESPEALAAATGLDVSRPAVSRLEELLRTHYHAPADELLQRQRIERAGRLLLAGERIDDVAGLVGYSDPVRFAKEFRHRMRLEPESYRDLPGSDAFELRLPSYFVTERVLSYLGRDPVSETERVVGKTFTYGTHLGDEPLAVQVELGGRRARCRIVAGGKSQRRACEAHAQVLRLLGLVVDPRPFEYRSADEPEIARLVAGRRGLTIPQTAILFDALVWVIAGQQVSLPVAFALRRRLARRIGRKLGDGLHAPPTVEQVAELEPSDLHQASFSRAKADFLLTLARAIVTGELDLEELARCSATTAERRLLALRGIGPWSANYLMMRALGFVDCVPIGDAALTRNLKRFFDLEQRPDADATRQLMQPFAPHRSLATFHLWALKEEAQ